MKRFWVSWIQTTEDYRPLTHPPHEPIFGWWCTGYDSDDNAMLVAFVEAANEEEVENIILKDWPEWTEWRFFDERDFDFSPSNRFELSDWMKSRISSHS